MVVLNLTAQRMVLKAFNLLHTKSTKQIVCATLQGFHNNWDRWMCCCVTVWDVLISQACLCRVVSLRERSHWWWGPAVPGVMVLGVMEFWTSTLESENTGHGKLLFILIYFLRDQLEPFKWWPHKFWTTGRQIGSFVMAYHIVCWNAELMRPNDIEPKMNILCSKRQFFFHVKKKLPLHNLGGTFPRSFFFSKYQEVCQQPWCVARNIPLINPEQNILNMRVSTQKGSSEIAVFVRLCLAGLGGCFGSRIRFWANIWDFVPDETRTKEHGFEIQGSNMDWELGMLNRA